MTTRVLDQAYKFAKRNSLKRKAKRIRFASRPKIVGPFALIRFRFLKKRIRYSENFRFFFAVTKNQ